MSGCLFYFFIEITIIFLFFLILYLNAASKDILLAGKLSIEFLTISLSGYIIYKYAISNLRLYEEVIQKKAEIENILSSIAIKKDKELPLDLEGKLKDVAITIYDIKNFLTIILLIIDIMESEMELKDEELARLKYASKMAANLSHYTLSILSSDEIRLEETDFNSILNEIISTIEPEFKINKIKLLVINNANKTRIKGNKIFLTRAILNLLLNSRSFVPEEDGIVKIEVFNNEKELIIKVSDNGRGFPDEILKEIEPFKSIRKMRTQGINTGLGLYSTLKIITGHNGKMKIYNQNGAVVEISIPLL